MKTVLTSGDILQGRLRYFRYELRCFICCSKSTTVCLIEKNNAARCKKSSLVHHDNNINV